VKLPLLISVPHFGLTVPDCVRQYCTLAPEQVLADSDVGADDVYDLEEEIAAYVSTDIARAVVDMNRCEEDRGPDGVIKSHTCYGVQVYQEPLSEDLVEDILVRYYRPYHRRLSKYSGKVLLGVDCHTMASVGPNLAPDPGCKRPHVCLSNSGGTLPETWFQLLVECFSRILSEDVSVNSPFGGGYIIRSHCCEVPWVQLEISREDFLSKTEKRKLVFEALRQFCSLAF
jgi:formiminoglutamase